LADPADLLQEALPASFFARPAEVVAPELLGCLLVRRQSGGALLWGVIVETEAYSQAEPACHGHRRRSPANETLFGAPGCFYVYVSYGIHHCVNVVTDRAEWANGVLLRAAYLPGAPERAAAGPGLLARCFGIDRSHDALPASPASSLWLASRTPSIQDLIRSPTPPHEEPVTRTGRVGVSAGADLPLRWYLRASRSVSRRAPGDRRPRRDRLAAACGLAVCHGPGKGEVAPTVG
jgi:DNA-3-methyladenine glycosylase